MPVLNRAADRFQRALEGERVTDAQLTELLRTSRQLVDLRHTAPTPDQAFVARLHERLMSEAAAMPAPSAAAARRAAAGRASARSAPVVVLVGRGVPRLVAGAVASAVLVGGVVGVASRSALPGDALYPVKGWIDGVAVRLADDDFDRGQTFLAQAQEHISDARELSSRDRADHDDVDVALQAAIDSVRNGQRALDASYTRTADPRALVAMRDFTARALPQVDALRTEAPVESLPLVARLEAMLVDAQQATVRRIAACGSRCADLSSTSGPASLPGSFAPADPAAPVRQVLPAPPAGSSVGARPSATRTSAPAVTAVSPSSSGGVVSAPVVSAGQGGVAVGGTSGGATLSTGGATVNLPTIGVPLPVPSTASSSSVAVPLPSATVGTGGVTATVPSATLGPITLPGVTVTLP
ncbi:DUF5667 domain-containing protein [Pedococcus sp. 5OH_020]|uniref:DUF5667 domain-containing protein n=1 Tax=Pedococcus sp. 5OH_020 TaxID=2989814 RepID=UPI0022E9DEDE|nr:DUF5667 domain-containing protein [Pedococcus sp. 5OH_020]